MFARSAVLAVVLGSLSASALPSVAAEPTSAPTSAVTALPDHPRDGGIIAGKITSVDYRRNLITVDKTDITLLPSTQIQGRTPGYHAVTDLKRGMPVEVYTSQVAGKYIAQIITLR